MKSTDACAFFWCFRLGKYCVADPVDGVVDPNYRLWYIVIITW